MSDHFKIMGNRFRICFSRSLDDRAVYALCFENVVCRTSSIKRHFQTKHEKSFKNDATKIEAVKQAVSQYNKQSSIIKKMAGRKNEYVKAAIKSQRALLRMENQKTFLTCFDMLFDDLPDTIISRIKDMPLSARPVERRIVDMATDVNEVQTVALQVMSVFSVAFDESVDINVIPRLAIVAQYCCNSKVHEELCCSKPMYGTTKEDIVCTFTNHIEERGMDIKKIFAVTTDGAPAMVGQHHGFVTLLEEKIRHPV